MSTQDAPEEQTGGREQTTADVRAEFEALMEALREANGHLILANLRSQSLAEQMNQLYEEARSAIQAKDDFFSAISHELRTPLTSIKGWAELLLDSPDAATISEAARSIASSAAVQAQLIDDLLDVSRIMTNKFAITEVKVDLRDVVDDGVSGMRPIATANGISLRKQTGEPVIVNGDPARLRQVLTNLLTNAIKFTPAGGLIEVRLSSDGAFGVIEVSDTGEGISAEFLPFVFERRSQATERRFAGLGLGLAPLMRRELLHPDKVWVRGGDPLRSWSVPFWEATESIAGRTRNSLVRVAWTSVRGWIDPRLNMPRYATKTTHDMVNGLQRRITPPAPSRLMSYHAARHRSSGSIVEPSFWRDTHDDE